MKKIRKITKALTVLITVNCFLLATNCFSQGAAINTTGAAADASAAFEVSSTIGGTLITRMTTAERNAVTSPAEGLQIFNIDTKCFEYFANNTWNQSSCAFVCGNTFIDNRDAQYYKTVKIGTQCWMKENLNYDDNSGNSWCYENNSSYCNTYGRLYTWDAATGGTSSFANPSGVQGVCPSGWHLPSDDEWQQLEMQLGMTQVQADATGWRGTNQGDQLKSTTLWAGGTATNSSGFTALPGGYRTASGTFDRVGNHGYWWSVEEDGSSARSRHLYFNNATVGRDLSSKGYGFAVRCLRD